MRSLIQQWERVQFLKKERMVLNLFNYSENWQTIILQQCINRRKRNKIYVLIVLNKQ